eukprot:scaffold1724_cov246-Pinguiococcus_pyrenoidosus.AAC.25
MEKEYEEELENIRNEPFARAHDDPRLERMRKEELRPDDPMLAYVQKQRAKTGKSTKKAYTGPPPPPNRFGIPPGYRWDGVDRGNGFEARVLAKTNVSRLESIAHILVCCSSSAPRSAGIVLATCPRNEAMVCCNSAHVAPVLKLSATS